MQEPERILLIRPSALGDVCRTTPILVSLRRRYPNARIDWLVQEEFADAIRAHPDLNEVVGFPRKAFAGWWRRPSTMKQVTRWLRELRGRRYDLVIDCQGLLRSGLFALATGARDRVGYANAAEFGWIGFNRRHRISRVLHSVDRMAGLIEAAGIEPHMDMRLYPSEEDLQSARALTGPAPYWAIAPTSRWPGKQWPDDRFRALVERALDDGLTDRIVLLGSDGERPQCPQLLALASEREHVVDLLGKTSVGELLAVISAADLVIANDSAALHMAVGCDRPIVALFGPTDIGRVGPYRRSDSVIQHVTPGDRMEHKDERSGRELMGRISVDEVMQAAKDAIGRGDASSRSAAIAQSSDPTV